MDQHLMERERVEELLAVLPVAERRAVEVTVLAGLSAAEAATALGCSPAAIYTRLTRARRRLSHHATPGKEDQNAP